MSIWETRVVEHEIWLILKNLGQSIDNAFAVASSSEAIAV